MEKVVEQSGGQVIFKHDLVASFWNFMPWWYTVLKRSKNPSQSKLRPCLVHLYFTVQDICLLPHISIKSTCTSSANPLLYTSRIATLRSLQHLSPRGLQHSLLPLPLPPNLQAPLAIPPTPLLLLLQLAQLLQLHLRRLALRRLRL